MSAPKFRQVEQHTGLVATCRRVAVEAVEGVIVTVGEALLRRMDHDYDLPLVDERMQGRFESDGPDAADMLPDELWHAQQPTARTHLTSAAMQGAGERPEVLDARTELAAPTSGHPNTAATPRAAATDPAAGVPPTAAGSPDSAPADFPAAGPESPLTFTDWATPAICDVLTDHRPHPLDARHPNRTVACMHHVLGGGVDMYDDWQDWREHVAPLIADRLEGAGAQRKSPSHLFAADFYEQHKKTPK